MIDINESRAIIQDGNQVYNDTPANLQVHSDGFFAGLPANMRQFTRRDDGSEYWVVEKNGDFVQESPSADYSLQMDSLFAMLPLLLEKQAAVAMPLAALNLPEFSTVQLGQAFEFDAVYTGEIAPNLSVDLVVVSVGYNEGTSIPIAINQLANPVQLMFKQAGFYTLTINQLEYRIEVQ